MSYDDGFTHFLLLLLLLLLFIIIIIIYYYYYYYYYYLFIFFFNATYHKPSQLFLLVRILYESPKNHGVHNKTFVLNQTDTITWLGLNDSMVINCKRNIMRLCLNFIYVTIVDAIIATRCISSKINISRVTFLLLLLLLLEEEEEEEEDDDDVDDDDVDDDKTYISII